MLRLLAFVMVVVVLVSLATPARAEADVLATVGIAMLVAAGVVVIAVVIIAAASDYRRGGGAHLEGAPGIVLVRVTEAP
jgi:hypothetical protein